MPFDIPIIACLFERGKIDFFLSYVNRCYPFDILIISPILERGKMKVFSFFAFFCVSVLSFRHTYYTPKNKHRKICIFWRSGGIKNHGFCLRIHSLGWVVFLDTDLKINILNSTKLHQNLSTIPHNLSTYLNHQQKPIPSIVIHIRYPHIAQSTTFPNYVTVSKMPPKLPHPYLKRTQSY